MMHSKTIVTDGAWAVVGTDNLDYRSLFLNYELTLVSCDRTLCRRLQRQFAEDLALSREIECARYRPGWPRRVANGVGWVARRWL